jgi:hypothetical protein
MLDGLQRGDATVGFMDDGFLLNLDEDYREITLDNGNIFNLEDKKYSELPEELQDKIKDFSFTVYYFDGITDEEIEEMFFRLNNGKPLSAVELTRVKAKSFEVIKSLATHELLTTALSPKAIQKYNNEAIVMNTYMTIYDSEPVVVLKPHKCAVIVGIVQVSKLVPLGSIPLVYGRFPVPVVRHNTVIIFLVTRHGKISKSRYSSFPTFICHIRDIGQIPPIHLRLPGGLHVLL